MTDATGRSAPSPAGAHLVTGEAVVLELRLAKLPSRGVAELIDLAVLLGIVLGLSAVGAFTGVTASLDGAAAGALSLTVIVAVLVGYPVLFETLSRGRSLGKMAMGLRVVRDDGGPTRFRHALVRGLLAVFEIYPFGVIAIPTSMISSQGKRVGDFLAGTVVVRERVPAAADPAVMMPPALAGWASTLQMSGLSDQLALTARQFLSRATSLTPQARSTMGWSIAGEVSQFVAPAPPPGCPPEPYLAAVMAERSRRELARYASPAPAAARVGDPPPGPAAAGPAAEPGAGFVAPS